MSLNSPGWTAAGQHIAYRPACGVYGVYAEALGRGSNPAIKNKKNQKKNYSSVAYKVMSAFLLYRSFRRIKVFPLVSFIP